MLPLWANKMGQLGFKVIIIHYYAYRISSTLQKIIIQ